MREFICFSIKLLQKDSNCFNMTSIHQIVKDEVARQVPSVVKNEVKKEMTPTFFESFFKQVMFDSQLNAAVRNQMPDILNRNKGIVEMFVKSELPTALNSHHLVNQAMIQQNADFQNSLAAQQKVYQDAESKLVPRLKSSTDNLIQRAVTNVANQQYVMQQMEKNVQQNLTSQLNSDVAQMEQRIKDMERSQTWGYVISGGIGAIVACTFNSVISKL